MSHIRKPHSNGAPGFYETVDIAIPDSVYPDCIHLGGNLSPQPTAPLKVWRECENASHPLGASVCSCNGCGSGCWGYAVSAPDKITRIHPTALADAKDGRKFNASLIEFSGKRLLAYRVNWVGSRLHIAELGADLQPIITTPVAITHPKCAAGQEDPRLFTFCGNLWLVFTGVTMSPKGVVTNVLLAELGADLQPVRVFEPTYPGRRKLEKNWMPFECDGELFASYSYAPHTVLRIDTNRGTAEKAYETTTQPVWGIRTLRGGAPPVRVGGELIHWFHSWQREKDREYYHYTTGVLATEAVPPFKVTRMTAGPVWQPDVRFNHLLETRDKDVVYPCGTILDGGRWLVSAGQADALCEIAEFDASEIDRFLVKV